MGIREVCGGGVTSRGLHSCILCPYVDGRQLLRLTALCSTYSVSKIKGAPCTRRAHFHGRVHDFRRCAPGVCTFFERFIIAIYWEGAWSNFRVHRFMGNALRVHKIKALFRTLILYGMRRMEFKIKSEVKCKFYRIYIILMVL